jgi:ribosomal protein L37AE/L43A
MAKKLGRCVVCGKAAADSVSISKGVSKCSKCGRETASYASISVCEEHLKAYLDPEQALDVPGLLVASLEEK